MKGFSGDASHGICIKDAYVKGKLDILNVAFASAADKNTFAKHVGGQLQKLAAAPVCPAPPPAPP